MKKQFFFFFQNKAVSFIRKQQPNRLKLQLKNKVEYFIHTYKPMTYKTCVKASTLDVVNVPNAKYLAHLPHQTPKTSFYQMFQMP